MYRICLIGLGNVGLEFIKKFYSFSYKNIYIYSFILRKNNIFLKRYLENISRFQINIFLNYRSSIKNLDVNIVIELIGNFFNSLKILYYSLINNKYLITANKNLIARNYHYLNIYFYKRIYFEASVFGGFPIIDTLFSFFKNCNLSYLKTVLNGTTNYVLHNSFKKNISLYKSLNFAVKNGLSERNPIFDLSGLDTFYKIYIINKLLNKYTYLRHIFIKGIIFISKFVINYLFLNYCEIRLLGIIVYNNNFFYIDVFPYFISNSSNFCIKRELNIVKLKTFDSGSFYFKGLGAGGSSTCLSIFNNLFNLYGKLINYCYDNKKYNFSFYSFKFVMFVSFSKFIIKNIILLRIFYLIDILELFNVIYLNTYLTNKRFFYLKNKFRRFINYYYRY
ncbi:MAG: hypothetical protein AAYR31_00390 [Candidatus Vidania fulgoroideorum]